MDKKQQISIPKYIWVIAAILVACLIFLIAVQVPFSQNLGKYNSEHESAAAQISLYTSTLDNKDAIQQEIDTMKSEYDKQSEKLFVNGTKTADDIEKMIQKLEYTPSSVTITRGVQDPQGRVSSSQDPLYTTQITMNFLVTREQLLDTLKYFESDSNGSYFVYALSFKPQVVERTESLTESAQPSEAESEASKSEKSETVASSDAMLNANLTLSLYYFNPDARPATIESSAESSAA